MGVFAIHVIGQDYDLQHIGIYRFTGALISIRSKRNRNAHSQTLAIVVWLRRYVESEPPVWFI